MTAIEGGGREEGPPVYMDSINATCHRYYFLAVGHR